MDIHDLWTVNRLWDAFLAEGVRPVRNVDFAEHQSDRVGGPESVIALFHGVEPPIDLRTLGYDIDWIVGLRCGWNARFIPTPTTLMARGYELGQEAGWRLVRDSRTGSKLSPWGVTKIPARIEYGAGLLGRMQHGAIVTNDRTGV